jgi:hypothetical protein
MILRGEHQVISVSAIAAALLAAQSAPAMTAPATSAAAIPHSAIVPAGTVLLIETLDTVGSRHTHNGDHFRIRLAEPLVIDGHVAIAAGATGEGEVIQAKAATFSGSPGELILAARYLDIGDARVPLRGFRISRSGASGTSFVFTGTSAMMLQHGSNFDVPAGSRADAKVAADTSVPAAQAAPVQETTP